MARPSPTAALVVGLFLLAAACSLPIGSSPSRETDRPVLGSEEIRSGGIETQADPLDDPVAGVEVRFAEGSCEFEVPDGPEPRCGTVAVPAHWSKAEDGAIIELAVAVFPSTSETPAVDPIIYLDGGPGSHALETIEFSVDGFLDPLRDRGEVIFFDQRGVGLSRPRLDCVEVDAVQREFETRPRVDDDEQQAGFEEALAACRARLIAEGNDLTAYNSLNNAHDVEAIRLALGYERWNLYGISYGTRLGLEILRRHPDGVRAAVLDSVLPPQVDSTRDNPATFLASWRRVVDGCGAEPACAAEGDLDQRVRAVVRRYEDDPVEVEIEDWIADEKARVWVDGDTIVGIVVGALYSPFRFGDVPELVAELEADRTEAVADFLSQDRSNEHFFSNGMFYAVVCHDEISFADPAEVAEAVPADPFGLQDRFEFGSNVGTEAFATCGAFDNGQASPEANQPVASDVPTLLMAGDYDPVTPAAWARLAGQTLDNAQLVVAPRAAHGVSTDECGMSILLAFLDAPEVEVDAGCVDDADIRYLDPVPGEVVLESNVQEDDQAGLTISTVRPAEWRVGSLGGDQYRQDSFLDSTQLYQLAGDSGLRRALSGFIEEREDLSLSSARPPAEGPSVGSFGTDALDPNWRRRTGRSDTTAVEWYEIEVDGVLGMVVLVAAVTEIDDLADTVLGPALERFSVSRG